ncbi:hypothetical protein [Mesorhizobium sp. ESP-6-2]|uniref:hypothetical protein n=1 Tax=Mesorhizobium sp. ESP-6-2 TaxID=2876625 RepID=UPI001CCC711B|nr:hypothetical protein [Mesorhizobium sp. ESP-6-2]MBZ9807695.1 hypothetical protein [Mesorhizobium sp. ESP-6-2]
MKIPAQTAVNAADLTRTLRRMKVPVDMTPADVMVPGNWANVFSKVFVDDEVIVWPEDRAWRLHLLVVEVGVGFVKTAVLHSLELHARAAPAAEPADIPDVPAGYKVNHAPKTGWRVLTEDPVMEVSRNHKSRLEATLAAITHAAKASGLAA